MMSQYRAIRKKNPGCEKKIPCPNFFSETETPQLANCDPCDSIQLREMAAES